MRRTRLLLSVAAAGGAVAAKRSLDARIGRWDTNPDPTEGDPLGLPDGESVDVTAADGARLRGTRCGDGNGTTVLLVHGYIESAEFWAPVVRRLIDAGLDVVAVDQRGHGRSDRGEAAFATSTLGDDVATWVSGLDLRDVVVAGHSMGGVATMAFAAEHPGMVTDRVRQLVLVATLCFPEPLFGLPDIDLDAARLVRVTDRIMATETLGLLLLSRVFGTRPMRSGLEATRGSLLATDMDTRVDAMRMLRDFDLRAVLPSISAPTVVVAGSHDLLTPLPGNEVIADLVPDARLEVLHGMGHMLMFEAPDAVTDVIVQATKPADAAR